jgi:hypothetical protein
MWRIRALGITTLLVMEFVCPVSAQCVVVEIFDPDSANEGVGPGLVAMTLHKSDSSLESDRVRMLL